MQKKHGDNIAAAGGRREAEPPTFSTEDFVRDFNEKNRILEEDCHLQVIRTPEEYFSVLFCRPDDSGMMHNYMQETGSDYWGDRHYNAVAYCLSPVLVKDKKTGELVEKYKAAKYDITRQLEECRYLTSSGAEKVISSPILYAGKTRTSKMARSIWGLAVDLDEVKPSNLRALIHYITKLEYCPMPSMITSSGGGLHLYYLFPMGVGAQLTTVRALQRLKRNLTNALWNDVFSAEPIPDTHQGIWQGFRIPGTPTKVADVMVKAFVPENMRYYSVRELNEAFAPPEYLVNDQNRPLDDIEIEAIEQNRYKPSKISLLEAKAKWPKWVPGTAGQWVCNRKLYDWWLNTIIRGGRATRLNRKNVVPLAAGRRYWWVVSLLAFGKKCGLPYEEVRRDAYSLLPMLEAMTVSEKNHFTSADIEYALELYDKTGKESLARYTRNYIAAKTGFDFRELKLTPRRGRSWEESLIIARGVRDSRQAKKNGIWHAGNGRKKSEGKVRIWCIDHPYNCNKKQCAAECARQVSERDSEHRKTGKKVVKPLTLMTVNKWWWPENPQTAGEAVMMWRKDHENIDNKSMCARECGITRPTVIRWWNATAEEVEREKEKKKKPSKIYRTDGEGRNASSTLNEPVSSGNVAKTGNEPLLQSLQSFVTGYINVEQAGIADALKLLGFMFREPEEMEAKRAELEDRMRLLEQMEGDGRLEDVDGMIEMMKELELDIPGELRDMVEIHRKKAR